MYQIVVYSFEDIRMKPWATFQVSQAEGGSCENGDRYEHEFAVAVVNTVIVTNTTNTWWVLYKQWTF